MSNAIVTRDNTSLTSMPVMELGLATERFSQMASFVNDIMKDGVDYGVIPGTGNKPTLLKPGAEKLTTFFGLEPKLTLEDKELDWMGDNHGGEPFFYFEYRYSLYRGDILVGEGDGSCNSWEGKYRYRTANRVCPICNSEAIIKGKAEYGGGWLCFKKKGGCGAKFSDGDASIEGQPAGKIKNDNPADLVNTIKKMAQKRALVAAVLIAVNASEFFTQDIEDYVIETIDITPPQPPVVVSEPVQGTIEQPQPPQKQPAKKAKDPWPAKSGPVYDFCEKAKTATLPLPAEYHYTNQFQLCNAIGGSWPNFNDQDAVDSALSIAYDHAAAKQEQTQAGDVADDLLK